MSEVKIENNVLTSDALIAITESAREELKSLMSEKGLGNEHGVRVGVKGGGCAGFSYILGFDLKKDSDEEFSIGGLKVFVDRAHGLYLQGTELDYQTGLSARGFVFNNPNAESSCGCGSSFSA